MKRLFLLSFLLSGLLFSASVKAQWTSDTMKNLQVCDTSGSQSLPKIGYTTDGGVFICWFDNRYSGYAVYVQRLDKKGNKMFGPQGLLVSGNTQSSSLVDYSMVVDDSDNAVIAFTDKRKTYLTPFVYKISSTGAFVWGANGIDLNMDSTGTAVNPVLAQLSSGDFVVAWPYTVGSNSSANIAMQYITRAGVKQWNNGRPLVQNRPANTVFDNLRLVAAENNFILAWYSYTGTFLSMGNFKILAQNYDANANPLWAASLDTIYDASKYSNYVVPTAYQHVVRPDNKGGALFAWTLGVSGGQIEARVQHIDRNGIPQFTVNGIMPGAQTGKQLEPYPTYDGLRDETYVLWEPNDQGQSNRGIFAQRLSKNGTQLWPNAGVVIDSMVNHWGASAGALAWLNGTFYNNTVVGSYWRQVGSVTYIVKAFKVDTAGVLGWGGMVHTASALPNSKDKIQATLDPVTAEYYMTWHETRNGNDQGAYAQNIWLGSPKLAYGLPLVDAHALDSVACAGSNVNLTYKTIWPFLNSNQFQVILSDGTSNFATADTLKVFSDSASGTTFVKLPDTLIDGTAYQLKVVGNEPESQGGNTSQNIIVYALPKVSLNLTPTSIYHFGPGAQLQGGTPLGGQYIGDGVDSTGFFVPGNTTIGTHTIRYVYTNAHGCSDTAQQDITTYILAGVPTVAHNISVSVYPNPVENTLSIKASNEINNGHLSVYNVLGQLVFDNTVNIAQGGTMQINTQAWVPGMYAVVIENNGTKTVIQVAKQ